MMPTILVVDDEPDVEALITQRFRRAIREKEMIFLFAHDGLHALSVLKEHPEIDLVLSDINMPRMDGLTLLKNLQSFDDQLRAVLVSAYGDIPNIRRAMNLGAFDFVTKPIEFKDLEVTIERAIADLEKLREANRKREAAEQARAALSRYFSPNLVDQLAQGADAINLSGERRELSFVFTDLSDFTALVEELDVDQVVPLVNEYLNQMTRIVFDHGGTLDKIVGDAVHAMFGAPVDQPDHAHRAVSCALAMDEFTESFRIAKTEQGINLGATRIGVHTGHAIVGNFGGEAYFDYTAHGDAVNTAARLESLNKHLGTRICVSETTVEQMDEFVGRPIGSVILKGKSEALAVFEPKPSDEGSSAANKAYIDAFNLAANCDPSARQAFAAYVGTYGADPLAMFHLSRLLGDKSGVDIIMDEK
jgi:adenylate cyclase